MCHSSDDNMVVLKTVITRAPRVIVSGVRVPVRMGPGPTNSYVDSRAKCERRQLAMLSLKYTTISSSLIAVRLFWWILGLSHI